MNIDIETIKKLAHLARLEFDEKSAEKLKEDLTKITDWMAQLEQLDTSKTEPLTHMAFEQDQLRPDVGQNTISREDALKNAPKKDTDYFRVPKVIE